MPENVLKNIKAHIQPQWKVCFLAALLVGGLAHLYKITNWLPNWDSLVFRWDPQNMVHMGRWFLPVACGFSSFYDLPLFNGLVAIVFHGLSAVWICRILHVQKSVTAFLIGAVTVSFPTVTSVMMYNYVADGYSIAFFLSTLAAFYMTAEKPRYLLAAILIALSAGIYQAYITVTIMLVLLGLLDGMIFRGAAFGTVCKKAGGMLLTGVLGVAVYGAVLKLLLSVMSLELIEYQGASTAASLSGIDLPASLYVAKETFRKCFFDLSGGVNVYVVLNGVVCVLTLVYFLRYIIKNKVWRNIPNLILTAVLSVLLVLGAAALALVNPRVDYHNLMRMGYCVFYLFFLLLYERGTEENEKHSLVKCWAVLLVALALIANQVVIANVSYHKAQMAYEKSYGILLRIADRIEQTPEAEDCDRILVIGSLENSQSYSVNLTPEITGITDGYILRADDEIVGQSVLCSALSDYCEKDYAFVSGEEKQALMQRAEIAAMGQWPAADCVAIVENTVIIKLGTEGEP